MGRSEFKGFYFFEHPVENKGQIKITSESTNLQDNQFQKFYDVYLSGVIAQRWSISNINFSFFIFVSFRLNFFKDETRLDVVQ